MSQPYIVLKQEVRYSTKNKSNYHVITMVGALDRHEYYTYVDVNNRNYRYWTRVINSPDSGFVLKGCQIKRDNLISADSRITIVWQTANAEDVFSELYDIWQEQDKETANHY
jgi:hypothetical protein